MKLNDETGAEPRSVGPVADGVIRVPLLTATLPPATRTNAYLVRGESGIWVVDPGSERPEQLAVLGSAMDAAAQQWGVPIAGAILTHHHPDHVAGLRWWLQKVALPVVAERRTIALVEGADWVPDGETPSWIEIDGDDAGGVGSVDGLSLLFTPGHAPGHLAVWTAAGSQRVAARVLICGDLVAGIGTIVVSPPRGNMADYLESLRRASELRPELLLPSHGPGTTAAVARLDSYLEHRLAREAKVMAAVFPDSTCSSAEVTAVVYADVPVFLHGFAERTVLAHLEKLVADGTVVESAGGYKRAT